MKRKERMMKLLKQYLLLCTGLAVMAFGVAFSVKADLGTSPISSVPYVVSMFTPFTVGTATIVMHCVFIALQILILRRRYDPIQLLQLPVAILFGYLTDLGIWAVGGISCTAYWQQVLLCIVGILLVGCGVSMEVTAGVVTLAGEGLVLAICRVVPVKFGNMKIAFDVTLVLTACVLSFLFLGGNRRSGSLRRPGGKADEQAAWKILGKMIAFPGSMCYAFFTAGDPKTVLCRFQDGSSCLAVGGWIIHLTCKSLFSLFFYYFFPASFLYFKREKPCPGVSFLRLSVRFDPARRRDWNFVL